MNKIRELYESYADIVEKVGSEKIQQRYLVLYQMYSDFIMDMGIQEKVKLNSFILAHAIMDYFVDISRLKDFHKIDFTNSYKIKAYEICWLLRRKPIQVIEDEREDLVYINEKFILSYTMSFLTDEDGNYEKKMNALHEEAFKGYVESFYYYLKYRNCNAQTLELALLSFGAGRSLK